MFEIHIKMESIVKKAAFLLLAFSILFLLSSKTNANSPPPGNEVEIAIDQIPEGCVYADLLVKIRPSHEKYAAFNVEYGSKLGIGEQSEIAKYREDGFTSYTFHFSGAVSDNLIKYESDYGRYIAKFAYYTEDNSGSGYNALEELRSNSPVLRIALLNADGEILDLSDEFSINPQRVFFTGSVYYSPVNDTIRVSTYQNRLGDILYFIVAILIAGFLRINFSILIETLIAIPFKLKPYYKIIITNFITQTLLTIAFALSGFDYLFTLIVIEVLVYVVEFFAYTLMFKKVSKRRILLYTIIANTVTLGFGLLLNQLGIFRG